MMDYRKELANSLIENQYLIQEELPEKQRSATIQQEIGHGLVSLPPFQKFSGERMVKSMSQYPPPPPPQVHPLADLLEVLHICALIACCSILKSAITILKDTS